MGTCRETNLAGKNDIARFFPLRRYLDQQHIVGFELYVGAGVAASNGGKIDRNPSRSRGRCL